MLDVLRAVDFKWTPAEIIENEKLFPGLIDDVFTVSWQRGLIQSQIDEQGETGED